MLLDRKSTWRVQNGIQTRGRIISYGIKPFIMLYHGSRRSRGEKYNVH